MSEHDRRIGTLTDSLLEPVPEGQTVADYASNRRNRRSRHTRKGQKISSIDAAWYVFDGLSVIQSEELLKNHGKIGSYLLSHYEDNRSCYRLSIKADVTVEGSELYRHYEVKRNGNCYSIPEKTSEEFPSVEEAVRHIAEQLKEEGLWVVPLFHEAEESGNYCIVQDAADVPPGYSEARRYPTAPQKRLPLVLRPTLRRFNLISSDSIRRAQQATEEAQQEVQQEEPTGCCYKLWHFDPDGSWYKPHKAGYITAFLILIGWIIFLLLFGWIIVIALLMVIILIVFAASINFACTGRCELGEDEDS